MSRLIGYVRVSSNGQAEHGFGLDVQEEQVRSWASAFGHEIVRVVPDEGVSGTADAVDRPGLSAVLDAIPSEADGVVMARLDRLARSITVQEAILATIWRDGGSVFTADIGEIQQDDPDDPMRTAMRQMAGVFAELDRRMIVKRLRDGRKAKAAEGGKAAGRYPFGWGKSGEIEREQGVLAHIRVLRSQGRSWQDVADDLNKRAHFHTRAGGKWTVANLHRTSKKARIS